MLVTNELCRCQIDEGERLLRLEELGVRQPPPLTNLVAQYRQLALNFDCYQVGAGDDHFCWSNCCA